VKGADESDYDLLIIVLALKFLRTSLEFCFSLAPLALTLLNLCVHCVSAVKENEKYYLKEKT
jgi:hypothetical protein